ncbi:MAG TPA: hypothetical protein VHB51_01430 [Candidatus Saccharimonadales bacterium]|nr:hypothetical protein [Candidatus Saccharimonadales bacterium]
MYPNDPNQPLPPAQQPLQPEQPQYPQYQPQPPQPPMPDYSPATAQQVPTLPAPAPQPAENPHLPKSTEHHKSKNPFHVMQPGEVEICEIKRHPIGMFGIYFGVGFLLLVLALLTYGVAPSVITSVSTSEVYGIGTLIFFVFAVMALGFAFVSNVVYWGNSWVLTSDSLTQITQTSLFHKQSSQLSLGNLEDVTADQNGIIPHLLNFGVLRVETAGEHAKFLFLYCPNPNYYAQQILAAREQFEQDRRGTDLQRLYRGPGSYGPGQPSHPQYQPPADPSTPAPQA